jgi:hypothetical protein
VTVASILQRLYAATARGLGAAGPWAATGGQAIGALLGRVAGGGLQLSAPGAREDDQQRPAPQDEDPAGEVDGGRPWLLDHAGGRPVGPPSVVRENIRKFVIGRLYWWSQLPQTR